MATFAVSSNTNYQDLVGAAGNDTYNITNGAILTIDTDTRWCTNHAAATGNLGPVNVTSGKLLIDGRGIRMIPYNGGGGNVPAIGTSITQGGVSAYLLGVWDTLIVAPTAAGAAMPADGYIKVKNKSGGDFAAGALGGITANATGADVVGWIEVVGVESATCTVPRLGKVEIKGEWFDVGTTSGVANQTIQMPASLANTYYPGVWIETGVGTGIYEFYPSAGSSTTTRQDIAGKVVWIGSQGLLRIGNSGAATNGYLPVSGCKIRVPNVITMNCTSAAQGSNAVPNTTLATRWDFTTTGGGYIDFDKVNLAWFPSFAQAFYVSMVNVGILEQFTLSEIASPIILTHVGVGLTAAQDQTAMTISLCFAGGTFDNCRFMRYTLGTSGYYVYSMTDCFNFTITNERCRGGATHGNATSGMRNLTRVSDSTWTNIYDVGAKTSILTTCTNLTFNTVHYCDVVSGSTGTGTGQFIASLNTNCYNIKFDGLDFWGLTNVHPYAGLFTILTASSNIKVRNIGSATTPLSLGSANAAAYVLVGAAGAGCKNIEFKRVYVSNTRTGWFSAVDNSYSNITLQNHWTDTGDVLTWPFLNTLVKGMKGTNTTTGQTSCYGTIWFDIFTAANAGRVGIAFNEKTSAEPFNSMYSIVSLGTGAGFNSAGQIAMVNASDEVIWETPYYIIGHTSFQNVGPTLTGVNTGNLTYQYKIDKNDGNGYGASWQTLNGANLSGEAGIDASLGFKLKIRITVNTPNSGNLLTYLTIATNATGTSEGYLYPLDLVNLTLTGLQPNSEVRAYQGTDPATVTEIGGVENSGTSFNFQHSSGGQAGYIQIHALGYLSIKLDLTYASSDQEIPIQQFLDRQYANP